MASLNLRLEGKIAILEFDQPNSAVNVLNTETMAELSAAFDRIETEAGSCLSALLLVSKKQGIFIAGADIKEIEGIKTKEEAMDKAEKGKEIINRLDKLNLITMAAINGACLGGGFELTLACKYRVASFSDKVKIGLPEVKLGIIPGFGGTIRLSKLAGLTRALNMILTGQALTGKEALRCGIVSRLFPEKRLIEESVEFIHDILKGRYFEKKKKKGLFRAFLEDTPPGRAILFSRAKKNTLKRTKGFYPAPLKAIETIKRTSGRESRSNFRLESEVFGELAVTEVSKNLIKVFFLIEKFKKFPWVDEKIKPQGVGKCGIVGAGVMGGGIAQLVSFKDIPTRVKDINYDALRKALQTAYGLFKYAVKNRKLKAPQAEYKFGLISPTVTYKGFENADVIIEAVVEDLEVKQKVFKEISEATLRRAIIASNTSSLPIIEISRNIANPEKAVGLHFFNPVHRMPLVEVIRSEKTSGQTLATIIGFARKLGKTVIVVKDVTGFLINRILLSYLNEAGFLLEEGMRIERIDGIMLAFGMPMGPVELIDEVGIDVGYKVAKILEKSYGNRMEVSSVLEKVKKNGLLGKKSNVGFYIHKKKRKKAPNPDIYNIVKPSGRGPVSDDVALKRMVYIMINEAARCLEEKVVGPSEAIDIGMIMGAGFPPFRAGLLRYADSIGISSVVKDLEDFEKEFKAKRFKPCDYLVDKARSGNKFYN